MLNQNQTRQQRRADERKSKPAKSWLQPVIWTVVVAAVIVGGWWLSRPANTNGTLQTADSSDLALCVSHGGLSLHIHPHLTIIVNGQEVSIPANTNISSSCLKPVHTHDGSGILHVESPRNRNFTLGQFFQLWGKPFDSSQFMDTKLDSSEQLKVFVNKKEVTTGPDTVLHDRTSYVIMVGKSGETLTPPDNYQFPSSI